MQVTAGPFVFELPADLAFHRARLLARSGRPSWWVRSFRDLSAPDPLRCPVENRKSLVTQGKIKSLTNQFPRCTTGGRMRPESA